MKIIIAGAQQVGTHLAKLLSRENMDVILMDEDPERIGALTFLNIMTLVGNPTSIRALREAEVQRADLFIAVTPNESTNIHACLLATNMGARRTMARIDNYEMQREGSPEFYRRIGISSLIYPELLGGQAVAAAIQRPWARLSLDFCDGHLRLLAVKVRDAAPIIGQTMIQLGHDHAQYHVAAIKRGEQLIIPGGQDAVADGDIVFFMTTPGREESVRLICGQRQRDIRRVVIMGGTRLGVQTAYSLPRGAYDIVFIEPDRRRGEQLVELVKGCKVIQGDAGDMEAFTEVHLCENDAFVALGDNSGSNVLACLNAKKLGVGKTVAEIEDVGYITMADNLNIGSTVNKKLLTASGIYQMLLDADKTSAKCYSLVDAEVADLVAQPGSKITEAPVMRLGLPRGVTLGGLVRDGVGMTVTGTTQVQAGDHVVVICKDVKISQVERFFTR